MEKKEYKVGETFQCGIVKLKVSNLCDSCRGCFFDKIMSDGEDCKLLVGECNGIRREDGTDVIFVKVED